MRRALPLLAAALLIAVVFATFISSGVTSIKMLGLGTAFAIMLDATAHTHVFGRAAGIRARELVTPGEKQADLPKDSADLALSRLDKLRNANGSTPTAELRLKMQRVMQNNCAVFRTGEVLALLGPSGSGKSTLLRLVAGLLTPVAGAIAIGGVAPRAGRPEIGIAFQDARLAPWRSVARNVSLPLELAGVEASRCRAAAEGALERVGARHLSDSDPVTLSGGERGRVALARAIVPLLKDHGLRSRLGEAGRARVKRHFDVDHLVGLGEHGVRQALAHLHADQLLDGVVIPFLRMGVRMTAVQLAKEGQPRQLVGLFLP